MYMYMYIVLTLLILFICRCLFFVDERNPNEEKVEDEVFEIIKTSRLRDDDYWSIISEKLGTLDLSRRPVYQQLGIGGVSGW